MSTLVVFVNAGRKRSSLVCRWREIKRDDDVQPLTRDNAFLCPLKCRVGTFNLKFGAADVSLTACGQPNYSGSLFTSKLRVRTIDSHAENPNR